MELPEDLQELLESFNADSRRAVEGFRLGVEHAQKLMFANLMALAAKRRSSEAKNTEPTAQTQGQ